MKLAAAIAVVALAAVTWAEPPSARRFSNVFEDAEIKLVLREVGSATGAMIVADSSVKGEGLSIQFNDDSIETALDKLAYSLGLVWKRKGDMYLVSAGTPDSPLFFEFAQTRAYVPRVEKAESLFALLARPMQAYAQVDKTSNLITVTAPKRQLDAVWKALESCDQPRQQFTVEALVTEMNQEDSASAGFSWNWRNFAQGIDTGLAYSQATSSDVVTMKALIGGKKATLLANPTVLASEGKEASITVGTETYYSIASGNANAPTIQFQKVNTGIVLTVTGFVEEDGTLNLHLQPEVSDAAAPVGGSPTTTVRKADTYVRVRPGEAIALGGLTHVTETNESSKVPVLGDIPLVGSLFRSNQKVKKKTEVVILIVPRLNPGFQRTKPAPVEPSPEPAATIDPVSVTEAVKAAPKLMNLGLPSKGAKETPPTTTPAAPSEAPSISKALGIGTETQAIHEPQKIEEPEGTADVSVVVPRKAKPRPQAKSARKLPPVKKRT